MPFVGAHNTRGLLEAAYQPARGGGWWRIPGFLRRLSAALPGYLRYRLQPYLVAPSRAKSSKVLDITRGARSAAWLACSAEACWLRFPHRPTHTCECQMASN